MARTISVTDNSIRLAKTHLKMLKYLKSNRVSSANTALGTHIPTPNSIFKSIFIAFIA